MKIIIYGLGNTRVKPETCLKPCHTIIGYTDSYSCIEVFLDKPFYTLGQLKDVDFDYIVLSVYSRPACDSIKKTLSVKYGIDEKRIVDFWGYYNDTLEVNIADYRISGHLELDGVVLGLSHAETGINTDILGDKWCNLAISSQDIYGNYKVFEYIYNKYKDRLCGLKYIIFDLFDYTYFNYDVSLAKNAANYLGMVRNIPHIEHNYIKNKTCHDTIISTGKKSCSHEAGKLLFDDIHKDEYVFSKYKKVKKTNIISADADDYLKPDYMPEFAKKHFRNTIQENIEIIKRLFDMFIEINRNIKIFGILIPRYYTVEEKHSVIYKDWRREFYSITDELMETYSQFDFTDYKGYTPVSCNNHFYADVSHLNEVGSAAFTSMLKKQI